MGSTGFAKKSWMVLRAGLVAALFLSGMSITVILPVRALCSGDVNVDGRVDVVDLSLVYAAFGSLQGQPNYNPNADFNLDGRVDIFDLGRVTANFGCGVDSTQSSIVPAGVQALLDAKNTGQTDVDSTLGPNKVEASNTVSQTFRVGVVVNGSLTVKIPGVYVWQFVVNYDPTVLVPEANPAGGGGPACNTSPDCADPVLFLGAQTPNCPSALPDGSSAFGGCNWNIYAQGGKGNAVFRVLGPGTLLVGFTFQYAHELSKSYGVTV